MAYVVILAALFCLSLKGFCGKKTSIFVRNSGDALLLNSVRMVFCIVVGIVMVLFEGSSFAIDGGMLLICLLSGISNALFLVSWMLAIQRNAMVTVDVTLTVGSILPAVLCAIFFGEAISMPKMIGFALIVAAALILSGYNKGPSVKTGVFGIIMLLLGALGDGMIGFTQQLYKQFYTANGVCSHGVYYENSVFQFYTFLFTAIIMAAVFGSGFVKSIMAKPKDERRAYANYTFAPVRISIIYIIIMAICLFAGSYLQTLATNSYGVPSQTLYPIIKGGCLITVNITAFLFFNEKFTKRSITGSLVALGGIIVMSIF